MFKRMGMRIGDRSGGAYIETAYVLMVFMWFLAVTTAVLPVFGHINKVNHYANHVARILSVEGGNTADARRKVEEYRQSMNATELVIDYSGTEFFEGYKVQLNDEIVVTVHADYHLEVMGIPFFIPIETKAVARSEVYYK